MQCFYVNYWQINEATTKDVYRNDIFALLGWSTVYRVLDLDQGFHQIELEEDTKPKTVFNSHHGLHESHPGDAGIHKDQGLKQSSNLPVHDRTSFAWC